MANESPCVRVTSNLICDVGDPAFHIATQNPQTPEYPGAQATMLFQGALSLRPLGVFDIVGQVLTVNFS
jgi:hypothetical protein